MAGEDFAAVLDALDSEQHECRVYLDDYANDYVVVDAVDYQWAVQWRWCKKGSLRCSNLYAYRTLTVRSGGVKTTQSIYLHVEIQERKGIKRTAGFDICDHRDGNTRNCRRVNLRYVTASMNRKNRGGRDPGVYDDEAAYYKSLVKVKTAKPKRRTKPCRKNSKTSSGRRSSP